MTSEQEATDLLDLLEFIGSGMSMRQEQIVERWPEWSALMAKAMARYDRDVADYRNLFQRGSLVKTSDPMVDSRSAARHHWVHLPLIRAAIAASGV